MNAKTYIVQAAEQVVKLEVFDTSEKVDRGDAISPYTSGSGENLKSYYMNRIGIAASRIRQGVVTLDELDQYKWCQNRWVDGGNDLMQGTVNRTNAAGMKVAVEHSGIFLPPASLIHMQDGSKYVVDMTHRGADSVASGYKVFNSIIVDNCTEKERSLITATINNMNGLQESEESNYQKALVLLGRKDNDLSVREISRVTTAPLSRLLRAEQDKAKRNKLYNLVDDKVLTALKPAQVNVLADDKLTEPVRSILVGAINKTPTIPATTLEDMAVAAQATIDAQNTDPKNNTSSSEPTVSVDGGSTTIIAGSGTFESKKNPDKLEESKKAALDKLKQNQKRQGQPQTKLEKALRTISSALKDTLAVGSGTNIGGRLSDSDMTVLNQAKIQIVRLIQAETDARKADEGKEGDEGKEAA